IRQPKRLRHRLVHHLPSPNVDGGRQSRELATCVVDAALGELQHPGERYIAEGERAGAADGAWHVGDAVVEDVFFDVGRVAVRRGAAGFDAASLVDGDVDD